MTVGLSTHSGHQWTTCPPTFVGNPAMGVCGLGSKGAARSEGREDCGQSYGVEGVGERSVWGKFLRLGRE